MSPVTLTPLEVLLLGGFISCFTGVVVRVWLGGRFVSHAECKIQRATLVAHNRDMRIIFRMLRGIIAHMDLTPEQRREILNETDGVEHA